jgi:hypothetical protein
MIVTTTTTPRSYQKKGSGKVNNEKTPKEIPLNQNLKYSGTVSSSRLTGLTQMRLHPPPHTHLEGAETIRVFT